MPLHYLLDAVDMFLTLYFSLFKSNSSIHTVAIVGVMIRIKGIRIELAVLVRWQKILADRISFFFFIFMEYDHLFEVKYAKNHATALL
jgi:hypothetical protein